MKPNLPFQARVCREEEEDFWKFSVFDPSQCKANFEWCLAPKSSQLGAAKALVKRRVLGPVGDNNENATAVIQIHFN